MPLIIGIAVLGALGIGVWQFSKWRESEQFNNGVCKCGGHFKKYDAIHSGMARGYGCDVCDKTVWLAYDVDVDYKYSESDLSKRRKEKGTR